MAQNQIVFDFYIFVRRTQVNYPKAKNSHLKSLLSIHVWYSLKKKPWIQVSSINNRRVQPWVCDMSKGFCSWDLFNSGVLSRLWSHHLWARMICRTGAKKLHYCALGSWNANGFPSSPCRLRFLMGFDIAYLAMMTRSSKLTEILPSEITCDSLVLKIDMTFWTCSGSTLTVPHRSIFETPDTIWYHTLRPSERGCPTSWKGQNRKGQRKEKKNTHVPIKHDKHFKHIFEFLTYMIVYAYIYI